MTDPSFKILDSRIQSALRELINQNLEFGHGGGDNGGMEPRIAKIESRLDGIDQRIDSMEKDVREIRADMSRDFRWTWGGLAGVFLILAGLVLTVYLKIDERFTRIDDRFNRSDTKIGLLEVSAVKQDAKLDAILDHLKQQKP